MFRLTLVALFSLMLTMTSLASPAGECVQQGLKDLGYYEGGIDGALGRKSVAAAVAFDADYSLGLPPLADGSAAEWCAAIAAVPAPVTQLDALPHPGELFFAAGAYDDLRNGEIASSADRKLCDEGIRRAPPVEEPADHVGWTHGGAPTGATFEVAMGAYWPALAAGMEGNAAQAKKILLHWAEADAMKEYETNDSGSWWATYSLLPQSMATLAELDRLGSISPAERDVVIKWLTRLISDTHIGEELPKGTAGYKDVEQRVNNHNSRRNLVAALWGVLTDDTDMFNAAVENGYLRFLDNIKPDGSLYDANRGKWAMRYTSFNISSAFFLAEIASYQGLDLFSIKRNGQSIHTAIRFLLDAADDQSLINKYAKADVGMKGMPFHGAQDPNWQFDLEGNTPMGWFEAYVARFPDSANAKRMRKHLAVYRATQGPVLGDLSFGNVSCIFGSRAAQGSGPVPPLSDAELDDVTISNVLNNLPGNADRVDTHFYGTMVSTSGDVYPLDFFVRGTYDDTQKAYAPLRLAIEVPFDDDEKFLLESCGVDFGGDKPQFTFVLRNGRYAMINRECVAAVYTPAVEQIRAITANAPLIASAIMEAGKAVDNPQLRAFAKLLSTEKLSMASIDEPPAPDDLPLAASRLEEVVIDNVLNNLPSKSAAIDTHFFGAMTTTSGAGYLLDFYMRGMFDSGRQTYVPLRMAVTAVIPDEDKDHLRGCGARVEDDKAEFAFSLTDAAYVLNNSECLARIETPVVELLFGIVAHSSEVASEIVKVGKAVDNPQLRAFVKQVATGAATIKVE